MIRAALPALLILTLAGCSEPAAAPEAEAPAGAPAAEAPVETAAVAPASALSVEDACRQAVEARFGQSGPAVTFFGGAISWRAPVDGGRLSFDCAVNGDTVSLTREGQTQTYTLNAAATDAAEEEAR